MFSSAYGFRFSRIAVAALGLSVVMAFGASSKAEEIAPTLTVYLFKQKVDDTVHYNKNPNTHVRQLTRAQYASGNPYVCTPSGFGQKARCFSRR